MYTLDYTYTTVQLNYILNVSRLRYKVRWQIKLGYLLQPKNGGVEHAIPMNQVKATAAPAWLLPNLNWPKGLQMTTYLSKARTAKDHPVTNPDEKEVLKHKIKK